MNTQHPVQTSSQQHIHNRPSRTKIVATLGPASDPEEKLADIIKAGVDVFRLNMAHGKTDVSQERLDRIRKISRELGIPVGVLADLAGPKMRLGEIPNGGSYTCTSEKPIRFVRGTQTGEPDTFTTTYEPLIDDLELGNKIMLADGSVICVVVAKDANSVTCKITQPGTVRSRQGVNLPGVRLSIRTLQDIDIINAKWATKAGVDFLGLSFVRSPDDIRELRAIIREEAGRGNHVPHIIAKIEKPEALERLEEIIDVADGIMVARGDLGVETDIAQIAIVQKRIIEMCHQKNKPVITATQMLESMHTSTLPTRAEATDVANAILDGTDACMLSGETAVGQYPIQAVQMMHRIALETEELIKVRAISEMERRSKVLLNQRATGEKNSVPDVTVESASYLAEISGAKMIIISTASGRTALRLSKIRHFAMTIGCSTNDFALQRMALYWGVIPTKINAEAPRNMLDEVISQAKNEGFLEIGDRIVLVANPSSGVGNRRLLYIDEIM
ncbi:MAG: pyruvate kinase [Planctomycetaceae bacterium]|jgi:pyruvate kinase|nr:pyruvate kinase [Planctomycetaceae bacterium]